IRSADCVEGAFDYVDIHFHPGVLVAFYREHNFFSGKILLEWRGLWGLRFVPFAITTGRTRTGVDIVRGRVAVGDLDGLPGHHAHHVRMIPTPALIQLNCILGGGEGTVT